jgi:ACR3 family arsenite transporter
MDVRDNNSMPADDSVASGNEDPGKLENQRALPEETEQSLIYKKLALLDRFLALWIFLAMAIGIILGNFVPNTGPALQKGKFVGVSIPIGKSLIDIGTGLC